MKKDNKLVKFTMFVLLITIVAIILVSGTYAKYTSEASGTATATVAKWSIIVNDDEEIATTTPQTVTFDLFKTINDSDGSSAETDVASGLIAPGTVGSFELSIKNESEVNAKYAIAFEVTGSDVPLEFSVNGGEWADTITAPAETTLDMGESDTVNVKWRWAFEEKVGDVVNTAVDTADTALGINAQTVAPEVIVKTTLTVTQVD